MFRVRPLRHRYSNGADVPPLEPGMRTARLRRGGPRTPIPLLPAIAVAAGIGIAYVSQAAGATQTSYEVSNLQAQQQQLRSQDQQLGDELAQLASSERIVAAAQTMGMRPAADWRSVAAKTVQILPAGAVAPVRQAAQAQGGALEQLVGLLSGVAASNGAAGR